MRPKSVAAAFELDLTVLPLTALLPLSITVALSEDF